MKCDPKTATIDTIFSVTLFLCFFLFERFVRSGLECFLPNATDSAWKSTALTLKCIESCSLAAATATAKIESPKLCNRFYASVMTDYRYCVCSC